MNDFEAAPRFLFESHGSRGDVVPLLSVAAELVRRGHRCRLLANEHFREEATSQGITFYPSTHERVHRCGRPPTVVSMYWRFDGVRDYFQRPGAFDANTVVVNTNVWSASEPFAEAHRLHTLRLTLFPFRINSLLSPPWPLGARAQGPEGERFLKVTLPAMQRAADTHPEILARINGVRAQVGLPPVRSAGYERTHVVAQAGFFPDWYGMPARDWPEMEFLGFPLPSSAEPLPSRLLEFLARVPRPLVFTTGTGFARPEVFFDAAASCCRELGMPGVFLSPFLRPDRQRFGDDIEHFEYVELEGLLRHAALIVHHGGMGTTARALQAGIPQVISPMAFDQPDNGHRVEVLGVGRVVPRDRLGGVSLAAAARELLVDAEIGSRLSRYRTAIAPTLAVEHCADLLEKVVRGNPTLSRAASQLAPASAPGRPACDSTQPGA